MGDDDHGHAVLGERLHDVQHLADHLGVEGAGGLVEEHDLRVHAQGPDDGHTLLLAAGELLRIVVGLVLQPDAGQELHGLGLGLLL